MISQTNKKYLVLKILIWVFGCLGFAFSFPFVSMLLIPYPVVSDFAYAYYGLLVDMTDLYPYRWSAFGILFSFLSLALGFFGIIKIEDGKSRVYLMISASLGAFGFAENILNILFHMAD